MDLFRVGLIIQARMGSERLPGKTLMDLSGSPLIERMLERIKRCKCFNEVILAIPETEENKVLIYLGEKFNVEIFAGSELDLLERYYQASIKYKLDYIVRIPGDNPIPEPLEIDKIVNHHLQHNKNGFSSNLQEIDNSGYPDGIGAEIFSFFLLENARNNSFKKDFREHIHLNFYDYKSASATNLEYCPISTIKCPSDFRRPELILDVNTYDQYLFIKAIYDYHYLKNQNFHITDIINWYDTIYNKDKRQ